MFESRFDGKLHVEDMPKAVHSKIGDDLSIHNQFYIEPKKEYQKNEISFMDFSNFERAWKTAEMLCKAKCIPQNFWDNPADVLVVIQCGHELGLSPMKSLQNMMIINNKPSIYGDAMLAVCMKTKGKVGGFIDCIETYDKNSGEWTCTVSRDGREPISQTFTMEEATIGGFLKKPGPWQTNRKRMMQFRPRAFALRDMFPDILMGVMTVEEMQDVESTDSKTKDISSNSVVDSMKERLKSKQSEPLLFGTQKDML